MCMKVETNAGRPELPPGNLLGRIHPITKIQWGNILRQSPPRLKVLGYTLVQTFNKLGLYLDYHTLYYVKVLYQLLYLRMD